MSRQLIAPLLGLGLLLAPATARAHGIESSLTRLQALSDGLMLQSQFSSGEPTRDALVRLVPPGGAPIELGRTDAQGHRTPCDISDSPLPTALRRSRCSSQPRPRAHSPSLNISPAN